MAPGYRYGTVTPTTRSDSGVSSRGWGKNEVVPMFIGCLVVFIALVLVLGAWTGSSRSILHMQPEVANYGPPRTIELDDESCYDGQTTVANGSDLDKLLGLQPHRPSNAYIERQHIRFQLNGDERTRSMSGTGRWKDYLTQKEILTSKQFNSPPATISPWVVEHGPNPVMFPHLLSTNGGEGSKEVALSQSLSLNDQRRRLDVISTARSTPRTINAQVNSDQIRPEPPNSPTKAIPRFHMLSNAEVSQVADQESNTSTRGLSSAQQLIDPDVESCRTIEDQASQRQLSNLVGDESSDRPTEVLTTPSTGDSQQSNPKGKNYMPFHLPGKVEHDRVFSTATISSPSLDTKAECYRPPINSDNRNETIHQCEQCTLIFRTRGQLNIHTNRRHRRRYACELCSSSFSLKADLQRHELTVHRDAHFKKQKCGSAAMWVAVSRTKSSGERITSLDTWPGAGKD